jgi:hypothetical protein
MPEVTNRLQKRTAYSKLKEKGQVNNAYFLDKFSEYAPDVLVAESRLKNIGHRRYQKMGEKTAGTLPELDAWDSHKQVILYEARQAWRRLCNPLQWPLRIKNLIYRRLPQMAADEEKTFLLRRSRTV